MLNRQASTEKATHAQAQGDKLIEGSSLPLPLYIICDEGKDDIKLSGQFFLVISRKSASLKEYLLTCESGYCFLLSVGHHSENCTLRLHFTSDS